MGHTRRAVATVIAGAALVFVAAAQGPVAVSQAPADSPTPKATGTLLQDAFSAYPRVIRLEHSGDANGRLIASVSGPTADGTEGGLIFESTDDGASFQKLSEVPDLPETAGSGTCCGTIYELPSKVGDLPEGTLLRASTVGMTEPEATRRVRQRVWRSDDHGRTWTYVSDLAVAPEGNHDETWEPEFSVTADGRLAAYYSDETDKANHDQKLVKVVSDDGVHWSQPENLVIHQDQGVRPGMASVRRLPDGSYIMAYEVCNTDLKHLCSIYTRTSKDGWDWGDPLDLGTQVRTPDGKYARHTPTLAWSNGPGPNGSILLVAEMLVNEDGSPAPGNGKTILANDGLGKGTWYEMSAPVQVDGVDNSDCKNFSPSLLPSADGTKVLEMATDSVGENDCRAYFATGPLQHP